MKQYKGFYVPRADKDRVETRQSLGEYAKSHTQEACFVAMENDCDKTREDSNDCYLCLFGDSEKEQKEAFNEWFKAKGKVEYDIPKP